MSSRPPLPLVPDRPRRADARPRREASYRPALLGVAFLGAMLIAAPAGAGAQGILVQGIADAEFWKTDSSSILLTRNSGKPGFLGRVHLWTAIGLGPHVVAYAAGTAEMGNARAESGTEWYTDLVGIRYTRSDALVIDAGKMAQPIGTFAARRYSSRNPLIGIPDGYPVQYPLAVQLSGMKHRVDYRAAVTSLPIQHTGYTPEPSAAPRPAIGAGLTPTTGIRIGASATWGPYLNRDLTPSQLGGRSWRSYDERIIAADAQVSRGYLELHGEIARSSYDVPDSTRGSIVVRGLTYYGEAKYTVTPRFFAATRLERNDYPYIQPLSATAWIANPTNMYDGEIGVGFRLTSQTLLKASVRADRWDVPAEMRSILGNGTAFGIQLSQSFDLIR